MCGCLQTEVAERKGTLGQHGRSEYHIWLGMMQRCHDPRNLSYWRYGGRGISVCDEWRESFTAFLAHVGDRPTPKHSIDRIDGNGNYEPGNVRWATKKEQARNRRSTLFVQWDGEKIPFIELCERQGRKYSYALSRYRGGVPLSRIFEGGASL